MNICARCKKEITVTGRIMRGSTCPHCGTYLHSCVNCRFYSPGRHNDCKEPLAEFVGDKRTDNFCDYFVLRETSGDGVTAKEKLEKNARDNFNKLFGG